jgi:hypothetical protein
MTHQHQVNMRIDQARQHGLAARVDDSGLRWDLHALHAAHLVDAVALYQDYGVIDGRFVTPVMSIPPTMSTF